MKTAIKPIAHAWTAWLLLTALTAPAMVHAEDRVPDLWDNLTAEAGALATAPVSGSWADYALAAGWAGSAVWALHHDTDWFAQVQAHRDPWQDKIMPPASLLGDGFVEIAGCAVLYKYGSDRDQKIASMAIEGAAQVALISTVLKFATSSTRPNDRVDPRQWLNFGQWDSSFPSGHSMSAFCLATIFGEAYHIEWAAYPLAALVAYSRVYDTNHWPADVIVGAGLGILVGQAVVRVHQAQTGPPGFFFSAYPEVEGGGVSVTWLF